LTAGPSRYLVRQAVQSLELQAYSWHNSISVWFLQTNHLPSSLRVLLFLTQTGNGPQPCRVQRVISHHSVTVQLLNELILPTCHDFQGGSRELRSTTRDAPST